MAENAQKPIVSISGVMALVAILTAYLWPHAPLQTERPSDPKSTFYAVDSMQDVKARLWEDPMEASLEHDANVVRNSLQSDLYHDPLRLASEISDCICAKKENVLVLSITETGQRYADDHESRLKSRYAAISALNIAGYAPSQASHIGYIKIPQWPPPTNTSDTDSALAELLKIPLGLFTISPWLATENAGSVKQASAELLVPFEWFEKDSIQDADPEHWAKHDKVLVLWPENEAFKEHPILRYGQLMEAITPRSVNLWSNTNLAFKIIGPRDSNTLKRMVEDTNSIGTNIAHEVEVYSCWASAADVLITTNATLDPGQDIKQLLNWRNHISLNRTICQDDELAGAIINELQLRGVYLTNGIDCAAIVSEWDTLYGRALPLEFAARLEELKTHRNAHLAKSFININILAGAIAPKSPPPANLWLYTYLEGIDGSLPAQIKESGTAGISGKNKNVEYTDRPEGQSQLDSVPRIVEDIKLRNREWMASNSLGFPKGLKAIGVLGSDVYDKLLLIQAFRENFPDAIFFTMDLDARLTHPSALKWTRNLIVASSFGLELKDKIQNDIPPFRDNYQTALFLSCLEALGEINSTNVVLKPRLYEVGRFGAYDLSLTPSSKDADTIYPSPPANRNKDVFKIVKTVVAGFVLSCLTCLILTSLSTKFRELVRSAKVLLKATLPGASTKMPFPFKYTHKWMVRGVIVILLLLPFVFAGSIIRDQFRPTGEPFSLDMGISIWPTEIIRLFVCYLTIYFFIATRKELMENKDFFHDKYFLRAKIDRFKDVWQIWKGELLLGNNANSISVIRTLKWRHGFASLCLKVKELFDFRRWIGIHSWDGKSAMSSGEVDGNRLWLEYNIRGTLGSRLFRSIPLSVLYFLAALVIFYMLGTLPFRPVRDQISNRWDIILLLSSVFSLVFCVFYVIDATRLCCQFIDNLTKDKTRWPDPLLAKFKEALKIPPNYLDEWIDIEVIANHTDVVSKLIFYPFALLFLMICSRSTLFDHWSWPVPLLLIFGLNSAYAIYSVIVLRRAAEAAREKSIESLNEKLLAVLALEAGLVKPGEAATAEQIQLLINKIETCEKGAFAPLGKHPVVRAVLMPFGGAGLMALIEYFAAR